MEAQHCYIGQHDWDTFGAIGKYLDKFQLAIRQGFYQELWDSLTFGFTLNYLQLNKNAGTAFNSCWKLIRYFKVVLRDRAL